ncbi:MAG TPA: hypothetical protein VKG65_09335 [Terriglobales bacterium]|nr:hypothetical protein [Terriglobales bacterium]
MYSPGSVRLLAAAAVIFFAVSLPAQRYYGRDHHVYHAPVQTKHPTPQSTNPRAHTTSTTAANSTGHTASAASSQSIPDRGAASNARPDVVTPPNPGERQPQ